MNITNTEKLIKDFPVLYAGVSKSLMESLMSFGFECGDGWFDLIYDLSKKVSKLDPKCEAMQVKEKFGGLRFYTGATTHEVWDVIDEYEERSYGICEQCGSAENVSQTKGGWIITLCEKCHKERERPCPVNEE